MPVYFLVSHRLLIDDTYSEPLKQALGSRSTQSLFILDEAHHAAPSSASKYAIDSRITRAVRELSPCFEHRLFLSATPHNGHSNSFSALLEILDPQRFTRGVPVVKTNLNDVMVRRLKNDIRLLSGGFPERVVEQIDIDCLPANSPELVLVEMLDRYQAPKRHDAAGSFASLAAIISQPDGADAVCGSKRRKGESIRPLRHYRVQGPPTIATSSR